MFDILFGDLGFMYRCVTYDLLGIIFSRIRLVAMVQYKSAVVLLAFSVLEYDLRFD